MALPVALEAVEMDLQEELGAGGIVLVKVSTARAYSATANAPLNCNTDAITPALAIPSGLPPLSPVTGSATSSSKILHWHVDPDHPASA